MSDSKCTAFVGQPISYYLDIWDGVRKEPLRLLKTNTTCDWTPCQLEANTQDIGFIKFRGMSSVQLMQYLLPE